MTGNGHGEQVSVGDRPESGSILIEGGAAFVVSLVAHLRAVRVPIRLDQAPDAVGEVMTSHVVGIDVQLVEDNLGDGSLHVVAASPVEPLRISEQIEGKAEELAALFQLAGGVGELGVDLHSLTLDCGELGFDLVPGPVGVADEIKEAILAGVEFFESAQQPLAELAEGALLATSSVLSASVADADEEAVSPLNRRNLIKSGLAVAAVAGLDEDTTTHVSKAVAEPGRYLDYEVVTAFIRQLDAAMHADGQAGSTRPLPAVLDVLRAVHQSARDVRPAVRRELLSVGARGAEFAGWLYRDGRNLKAASYWHDRATEWAQEACDFPMQGYVLLKRAQMAYDERDAVRVFTLAEAARRGPWQLPARVRAEVAQIEARGMAMLGEPMGEVERTLDTSRQWLDRADADESPLGGHYSATTFTLQTASCYIEAGQPRWAADLYDQAFREHRLSHRDQGYFMARRSVALALAGAPDEAAVVGLEAAGIATATDSQRTFHHLRRTVRRLEPWSTRPAPRALAEAVRQSATSSLSG